MLNLSHILHVSISNILVTFPVEKTQDFPTYLTSGSLLHIPSNTMNAVFCKNTLVTEEGLTLSGGQTVQYTNSSLENK